MKKTVSHEKERKFEKWSWIGSLLFIAVFLFMMFSFDIFEVDSKIWHAHFFNHFFVDGSGKFAWIGLTSIMAIVTLLLNAIDSRRRFRADLISKSRIDWMKQVRPIVAKYYAMSRKYIFDITDSKPELTDSELNENLATIETLHNELLLYIPDNPSNNQLLVPIAKVWTAVSEASSFKLSSGEDIGYRINRKLGLSRYVSYSRYFDTAAKDGSKYFKTEWDKAKIGK